MNYCYDDLSLENKEKENIWKSKLALFHSRLVRACYFGVYCLRLDDGIVLGSVAFVCWSQSRSAPPGFGFAPPAAGQQLATRHVDCRRFTRRPKNTPSRPAASIRCRQGNIPSLSFSFFLSLSFLFYFFHPFFLSLLLFPGQLVRPVQL